MNEFFAMADHSWTFQWIILPLLIFLARITDQTIGTLRLIFLSKGYRMIAPLLGFFEVIIWLVAVSQIMKHLDNVMSYVAYGAGFAMGNYIGMTIERKISLGNVIVRIILKDFSGELKAKLNSQNFGLTIVDAVGSRGNVKVLFSILKRKDLDHFLGILDEHEPGAFYTIEEVKSINEGIFRRQPRKSVFDSLSFRILKAK
jgi:uncharacterized protein YebE (UPF0316 family)